MAALVSLGRLAGTLSKIPNPKLQIPRPITTKVTKISKLTKDHSFGFVCFASFVFFVVSFFIVLIWDLGFTSADRPGKASDPSLMRLEAS